MEPKSRSTLIYYTFRHLTPDQVRVTQRLLGTACPAHTCVLLSGGTSLDRNAYGTLVLVVVDCIYGLEGRHLDLFQILDEWGWQAYGVAHLKTTQERTLFKRTTFDIPMAGWFDLSRSSGLNGLPWDIIAPPPIQLVRNYDLTPKELQVLELIGTTTLGYKGIARRLGSNVHTVKSQVQKLMNKLGLQAGDRRRDMLRDIYQMSQQR